jgi:tRNA dimethylallyltransferase
MFREPDMPPDRRERLKRYLDALPLDTLVQASHVLDPRTADRLTPGDRQRHARSVEVALLTGQPLSRWQDTAPPPEPPADLHVFVLEIPPALLRDRIDARVATMIDMGLRGEVARLLAGGYASGAPGMDATGYAEMVPHLAGEYDLDEAVERIRAATRRYARRQRTWLRRQLPPGAVRLDATRSVDDLADEVVREWRQDTT